MTSPAFDVQIPATEIQIGEAIKFSDPDVADTIRRLAFQRDRLLSEIERLQRFEKAVNYADQLGISAVPIIHGKVRYWRLRLDGGFDAPLGWLLRNEPNHSGWLSWSDAIIALGDAIVIGEVEV